MENKIDFAQEYLDGAREVAGMIGKLQTLRDHWQYLSEKEGSNGDPWLEADDALRHLGILLGTLVVYQMESVPEEEKKEDGNL